MFMFEGNAVALEIYRQMEYGGKKFNSAVVTALSTSTTMIMLTGVLSYTAFAQMTQPYCLDESESYLHSLCNLDFLLLWHNMQLLHSDIPHL